MKRFSILIGVIGIMLGLFVPLANANPKPDTFYRATLTSQINPQTSMYYIASDDGSLPLGTITFQGHNVAYDLSLSGQSGYRSTTFHEIYCSDVNGNEWCDVEDSAHYCITVTEGYAWAEGCSNGDTSQEFWYNNGIWENRHFGTGGYLGAGQVSSYWIIGYGTHQYHWALSS